MPCSQPQPPLIRRDLGRPARAGHALAPALIVVVAASLSFVESQADDRPLVFVGNRNIPPMIFIEDDEPVGLVVDLARAAAEHAGLDVEILALDWSEAQRMVRDGEADALLQINPSPEREQVYDFSAPLLKSEFVIFRRSENREIQGMGSLAGLTVGVEAEGYPADFLHRFPKIGVRAIPSWRDGFELVESGEIDAVIVDRWVGEYELFSQHIQGIEAAANPVDVQYSAIAVRKDHDRLLGDIDRGLRLMEEDGIRRLIQHQWSNKEVIRLTKERLHFYWAFFALFWLSVLLILSVLLYTRRIRRMNRTLAAREEALAAEVGERRRVEAELKRANRKLRVLADTDALTGLANRRQYYDALKRQVARVERGAASA